MIPSWFSYSPGQGFWVWLEAGTRGLSLAVQWLKRRAFNAGGTHGSVPGWGTEIPRAAQSHRKIGEKKETKTLLDFTTWSWREVAESCPALFDPMDWSLPAPPSMEFPRQEYCSGLPLPSPGDRPDPGMEPRCPVLQADALPSEPPGKPSVHHGFPCFWPFGSVTVQPVHGIDHLRWAWLTWSLPRITYNRFHYLHFCQFLGVVLGNFCLSWGLCYQV